MTSTPLHVQPHGSTGRTEDDAALARQRVAAGGDLQSPQSMRLAAAALNDGTDWSRVDDASLLDHLGAAWARGRLSAGPLRKPPPCRLVARRAKAPPPPAATTPSQLRAAPRDDHWVQFSVVDRLGHPVSGLPYQLTTPGAPSEKGTLPSSGQLRKDGLRPGTSTLALGEWTEAGWLHQGRQPNGPLPLQSAVNLVARCRHVPPGTKAKFKVFRLHDEEPGRALATLEAQVDGDGWAKASFQYAPDGSEHGLALALIHACSIGPLWIKSPPLTLALPRLLSPRWPGQRLGVGDTARLSVDCPGHAEGTAVHFTVFRLDTGASIAELDGQVVQGRAEVSWLAVDPDPDTPETEVGFEARCGGLRTRSRRMRLVDDVELVFQDRAGKPLAHQAVTVVFADGGVRLCVTDAAGVVRLQDPRARTARVELAGVAAEDVAEQPA